MPFLNIKEFNNYLKTMSHHNAICDKCSVNKPTLIYDCKCVMCDDCATDEYNGHHFCDTCGDIDSLTCIKCHNCDKYICQSCMTKKCKCGSLNLEYVRGYQNS